MEFKEYSDRAIKTAIYPRDDLRLALAYTALELTNEAGEVAGKIKKLIRDGNVEIADIGDEIGDVLWALNAVAKELNLDLDSIARLNLRKLEDRQERGALRGSGDKR